MYSIGTNNLFCALNFGVVVKHTIHFKKGASPTMPKERHFAEPHGLFIPWNSNAGDDLRMIPRILTMVPVREKSEVVIICPSI